MRKIRTKLPAGLATALALSTGLVPSGFVPGALAQDASVAEQTVDAMNRLWGKHPGARANHAKGIVVEGRFTPTGAAARLSKATLVSTGPIPVTARFSDSTGVPDLPDGSGPANPHGMAVKLHLPR